jgi:hypothetical protein
VINRDDIRLLRRMIFRRASFDEMGESTGFPRSVLVEAYWAVKRCPRDDDALDHLRGVLWMSRMGLPMVNGRPAEKAEESLPRPSRDTA